MWYNGSVRGTVSRGQKAISCPVSSDNDTRLTGMAFCFGVMMEFPNSLYRLLEFQGYATRDLDLASSKYYKKFKTEPKAFVVRSPFMIRGSISNKRLLVLSSRYGGHAAVYIPTKLDKDELLKVFSELEESTHKLYVDRRKIEAELLFSEMEKQNEHKTYYRHCNYCGSIYSTEMLTPVQHCSKSICRMKHKEYLEELARRRKEAGEKINSKTGIEPEIKVLPPIRELQDFTLEDMASRSLQGWIYFIEASNGYIKIGRSDDPSSRFMNIVNMSPIPIWLRHTVFSDNCVLAEGLIHEKLKEYRRHGEWFELPEEIMNWCIGLDHYDLDD